MSLYEVLVRQTYFGKNPINRFHFNMSGTPASVLGSFALMSALGFIPDAGVYPEGSVFDLWAPQVSESLFFREVQVSALYDVTDFYVRPFVTDTHGANGTEPMAPFAAYGIHSSRVRTDIQGGSKRFCGVTEDSVGPGGVLVSARLGGMQALCDALNEPITYDDEGNTLTFQTCVLGFEEYTTPDGNRAYRKYATETEQLAHAALGVLWTPQATMRSQVSRQY